MGRLYQVFSLSTTFESLFMFVVVLSQGEILSFSLVLFVFDRCKQPVCSSLTGFFVDINNSPLIISRNYLNYVWIGK